MVSPPYIRCWNKRPTHFCGDFSRKAETKHEAQFPSSFKHLTWCGSSLSIEQDLGWRTVLCQCPCLLPTPVGPCWLLQPARTSGPSSKEWTGTWAKQRMLSLAFPILMGISAWGLMGTQLLCHRWGLEVGGGGGTRPPLQRACKKQQLPCPVQEAKLWPKYAAVQGKKIPMQYKEINTDINTNNPISFVLTAW